MKLLTYAQVKAMYYGMGMTEPDLGTFIRQWFENVYDDELNWIGFTIKLQ